MQNGKDQENLHVGRRRLNIASNHYIVYGFHLWHNIPIPKDIFRKPTPQHPGLRNSLENMFSPNFAHPLNASNEHSKYAQDRVTELKGKKTNLSE